MNLFFFNIWLLKIKNYIIQKYYLSLYPSIYLNTQAKNIIYLYCNGITKDRHGI